MVELDVKDRKLLYELDRDSRQSLAGLAKKTGLGRDAAAYRVNRLVESGVIRSFYTVIDASRAGFLSFRVLLHVYNTTPRKEQEIVRFLLANPHTQWLVRVEGRWDVNMLVMYRTMAELSKFWAALLEKYGNYLSKREFAVFTLLDCYGRPFILDGRDNDFRVGIPSTSPQVELDGGDMAVLRCLAGNARMPVVSIAQSTGLAPNTVMRKIKRLEKEKVILGYRLELDFGKLGYSYYKIHAATFNMTRDISRQIDSFVYRHPNIVYRDYCVGGYDLELEVQAHGDDGLRSVLDGLRGRFGGVIRDYEVLHYLDEHRLRFLPETP